MPPQSGHKARTWCISNMPKKRSLRHDTEIFLVGHYAPQIIGSKLPSNRDVLRVLFFNLREVKLSVAESAKLVLKEVLLYWEQARIPTRDVSHCVKKVQKPYKDLRRYKKTPETRGLSATQKEKKTDFINSLDNLFDIAHADALTLIKIEEDRNFLLKQRQPGRTGCMFGIDRILAKKEERVAVRKEKDVARATRSSENIKATGES